jgi:hypothetical protein
MLSDRRAGTMQASRPTRITSTDTAGSTTALAIHQAARRLMLEQRRDDQTCHYAEHKLDDRAREDAPDDPAWVRAERGAERASSFACGSVPTPVLSISIAIFGPTCGDRA